jgi:hypothetical protein
MIYMTLQAVDSFISSFAELPVFHCGHCREEEILLCRFLFHYGDQLAKRQEYFLLDIDITRERLLTDKRQLQAIITNPNTAVKDKLDATNSDIQLKSMKVAYLSRIADANPSREYIFLRASGRMFLAT